MARYILTEKEFLDALGITGELEYVSSSGGTVTIEAMK